jgi:DNA-binding NarL/FixJ family response regulator
LKILVIDEHPSLRLGQTHLLLRQWPRAEVAEAESIVDALAWLASNSADPVLALRPRLLAADPAHGREDHQGRGRTPEADAPAQARAARLNLGRSK